MKTFWFKNAISGKLTSLIKQPCINFYPTNPFELYLKFGSDAGGITMDKSEPTIVLLLDDVYVCEPEDGSGGGSHVFCKVLWQDRIGYINLYHLENSSKSLIYKQIVELVKQKKLT